MSIKYTPRGVKLRGKFERPKVKEMVKEVFKRKFPNQEPKMISSEDEIIAQTEDGNGEVAVEMDSTGVFFKGQYDKDYFLPLVPLLGMAAQAAPQIMEMFKKKKKPKVNMIGGQKPESEELAGEQEPGKIKGQLMNAIALLGNLLGKAQTDVDGVLDAVAEYDDEDLENILKEAKRLIAGG